MDYSLITNPTNLLNQILKEVPNTDMPKEHDSLIRFFVHYIWRGMFESRRRYIWNLRRTDASGDKSNLLLLCLAVYKGLIPVIHLARLGYVGDALTLLRTNQERIALLGYLDSHRDKIIKYEEGKSLFKMANKWAKEEWADHAFLQLYPTLYGQLSKFSHSFLVSTASLVITDNNVIGRAFRKDIKPDDDPETHDYSPVFIALFYSLILADHTAERIFDTDEFVPIPNDPEFFAYFSKKDIDKTHKFFEGLIKDVSQK